MQIKRGSTYVGGINVSKMDYVIVAQSPTATVRNLH